ncbi:dynein light chain type 1 domain-containing protein [Ditylenchus destructor]|uniref:Dynein light chain n=1 Tax=Ditylenchus destructor TaxID=166010 RepID=A0AAD4RCB5_9BILA|nr:dynein light chain type 1 domain-containing protein [Ditylenchus destructor]
MNQTASTKIKRYRNAIVNEIEMPDDMKNMVIDVAVKAFKKHRIEDIVEFKSAEKVAENIRNHFRKKYGGEWCCIIGQELAYYVAYEKYFISFNLGKVRIMLFKSP